MQKLRTAVIGVGYLGKFHAQKYANLPHSELVAICDTDFQQVNEIAQQLNTTPLLDYQALTGLVDAVSIATPTPSHHKIARYFLEQGVHVLLEKPIAVTLAEADDLIQVANKAGAVFQIGHIERFNNVIQTATPLISNPRFIESMRLAPFKVRGSDVSVILDLMIHDIDLIQSLVQSPIQRILANGAIVFSSFIDIANARLEFENACVANVTASRISGRLSRRMYIFQHDRQFNLDLQHKKLKVMRKGQTETLPGIPDIISERKSLTKDDPLKEQINAFLNSILEKKPPMVSGEDGKNALKTALKITKMITEHTPETAIYAE